GRADRRGGVHRRHPPDAGRRVRLARRPAPVPPAVAGTALRRRGDAADGGGQDQEERVARTVDRRWDVTGAVGTVEVGDVEVAYTEAGEGRPVVFVHGLAEDRATWAVQQRALTGVRTVSVDLRGHGTTTLGR